MRSLLSLLLLCALLGLAACGGRESSPGKPSTKNEPPPGQLASWKVELKGPEALVSGQPAEFTASVRDLNGQPVTDAQVQLSLKMKSMDMGENKSKLKPAGAGVYSGKAIFTMAGPWEVEVQVTKDGLTAIETFPFSVKEPSPAK